MIREVRATERRLPAASYPSGLRFRRHVTCRGPKSCRYLSVEEVEMKKCWAFRKGTNEHKGRPKGLDRGLLAA